MKNSARFRPGRPLNKQEMAGKYTGDAATGYDAQRIGTPKWEFEQRCVEVMLPACATVLDVPVGSGRFLDLYRARGIAATGMDISADMLAEAAKKAPAVLMQGDIFTHAFPEPFDCVVCVRFLNWFAAPDLARVVAKLAELTRRYVLASITTTEDAAQVKSTGTVIPDG